jgi:hypothetical protein
MLCLFGCVPASATIHDCDTGWNTIDVTAGPLLDLILNLPESSLINACLKSSSPGGVLPKS